MVRVTDADGSTPLMLAAESNCAGVVAALLSLGAPGNINAKNDGGKTALHLAAARGHCRVVRQLLEAGADGGVRDHRGDMSDTALTSAIWSCDEGTGLNSLLSCWGASIDASGCEGTTAVHAAFLVRSEECGRGLLAAGASAAKQSIRGGTVLMAIAPCGDLTALDTVLRSGRFGDLKVTDQRHYTALSSAVLEGQWHQVPPLRPTRSRNPLQTTTWPPSHASSGRNLTGGPKHPKPRLAFLL